MVFAAELRGASISDSYSSTGRIQTFSQHQSAGFLQSQPLLELQWAHSGDGFEVVMESRDAHPKLACDALDSKRLVKVLMEALNGLGDVESVAA